MKCRTGKANIGLLVAIVVVVGFVVWCLVPVTEHHVAKPVYACLSNVKQYSIGLLMYADESDSRLSPGGDWQEAANPYLKNGDKLGCPAIGKPNPNALGYAANEAVAGTSLKTMLKPEMTALVFESSLLGRGGWAWLDTLPNPARHEGRNNISFADGHARSMWMTGDPAKARK